MAFASRGARGYSISVLRHVVRELLFSLAAVLAPAALGAQADGPVAYDFVDRFGLAEVRVAGESAHADNLRPGRDEQASALVIPTGTALAYYTKVGPGSTLVIDDVVPTGGKTPEAPPVLRVEIQAGDGAAPEALDVRPRQAGRVSVSLPVTAEQPARITLAAVADHGGAPPEGGVRLIRPALHGAIRSEAPSAPSGAVPPEARVERPHVIIYLIDTLRADHLGCYGYSKPTSPQIDAFANDATRFANAIAQSSWTRTSVASILTGQDPHSHGVHDTRQALPQEAVTLAEMMDANGYETAAFSTNAGIVPQLGFAQGFRSFEYLNQNPKSPQVYQYSDRLNERVFEWLGDRDKSRPFFLYLHATDPHTPYTPPSPYRERFAPGVPFERGLVHGQKSETIPGTARDELVALYDAEIANNDANFGALLDRLRALDLYDSTLVVLVADHGEEFYDHGGWFHGFTVYMEQLHVPLLVKFPRGWGAGRSIASIVRQVDILPTILDYLGKDVPPQVQGRSTLPLLLPGGDHADDVPAYASRISRQQEMDTVIIGKTKLIRNISGRTPELEVYDLAADPFEHHNLAGERPVTVGYMRSLLMAFANEQPHRLPQAQAVLNAAQKERLRALGYGD